LLLNFAVDYAILKLKKTRTDWVCMGCWGWTSGGADENNFT